MTQTVFLKPLEEIGEARMKVLKELILAQRGVEYVDVREDMLALEVVFDERVIDKEEFVGMVGEETGIRIEAKDR